MKSKTEYRTVRKGNFGDLDREVNKLLEEGFSLYGNPYVTDQEEFYVCQALIRESKPATRVGAL